MLQVEFMLADPPDVSVSPVPGHFFQPLFVFNALTILNITVPAGYDLDDCTILEMARAWPCIDSLSLSSRSNYQPRCTLSSLEYLARQCPLLSFLSITLDASNVPPTPQPARRQDKLTFVRVDFSSISDDIPAVAAFISSLFWNVTNLGSCLWDDDVAGRQHQERWAEVEKQIPGLLERRAKQVQEAGERADEDEADEEDVSEGEEQ
ncbi:hypothetical protein K438DRAFT_805118 [Mycena galopus ATCC 62051]|nr:hypothetical protein K438DRAFT_805118 [Mycena galopus ATCC 62051]